jgi:hypothetical protein
VQGDIGGGVVAFRVPASISTTPEASLGIYIASVPSPVRLVGNRTSASTISIDNSRGFDSCCTVDLKAGDLDLVCHGGLRLTSESDADLALLSVWRGNLGGG